MKQNLRETLENRRDANSIISRRRLDLKHYVSKQAVDSVEDKDIIQKLTRDIEALANIITDKDYYRVVVDFYVDRLVRDEIFKITQYIISRKKVSTIEKYIYDSLIDSGIIVEKTNPTKVYFVDMYSEEKKDRYYELKDGSIVKCRLEDRADALKLESKYIKDTQINIDDLEGFLTDEQIANRFKTIMRDKEGYKGASSGSICHANSKLLITKLKDMIKEIDPNLNVSKGRKGFLCDMYELVLRKHKPKQFARPYLYSLWMQQHNDDVARKRAELENQKNKDIEKKKRGRKKLSK